MRSSYLSRRRWLQGAVSLAGMALLSGALNACGGSETSATTGSNVTQLEVGCDGDLLAFDPKRMTAPVGTNVALTFHNRSNHHQHNWVLVNGDDDAAMAVYEASLAAGIENDWLPPDNSQIIVHTPLVKSGNSVTIQFQAPAEAGNYLYLCTFPGHYLAGMKGILSLT